MHLYSTAATTLQQQHLAQHLINQRLAHHADTKQLQTRLDHLLPD